MKEEASHLALQLEKLQKLYEESKCTQCYIMQQFFKREYRHIKEKLQSLENLANSNMQEFPISDLKQSTALLGMYVMV